MKQQYNEVPKMISGKDLDYLSDMFNWHYVAYKQAVNGALEIGDDELCSHLKKASKLFLDGMTSVVSILEEGDKSE